MKYLQSMYNVTHPRYSGPSSGSYPYPTQQGPALEDPWKWMRLWACCTYSSFQTNSQLTCAAWMVPNPPFWAQFPSYFFFNYEKHRPSAIHVEGKGWLEGHKQIPCDASPFVLTIQSWKMPG